jgi:radical SAM-linked protein
MDTLRHINKTIKRAKIDVEFSKGFNPHRNINLSAPLPVGLQSISEYCVINTDFSATDFVERFNQNSPKGIKCIYAVEVDKKINVAHVINRAVYKIEKANLFDVEKFLADKEILVKDKHGKVFNARERIFDLHFEGDTLFTTLSFGSCNFRIDDLLKVLSQEDKIPLKIQALVDEVNIDDIILNN